jgi:hypothetical protein
MVGWLVPLLIGIALNVIAYLIMPKPKTPKPPAAKDMEDPTAEAGRPIPVVFGSVTIKGINLLWYGQKTIHEYMVKA